MADNRIDSLGLQTGTFFPYRKTLYYSITAIIHTF